MALQARFTSQMDEVYKLEKGYKILFFDACVHFAGWFLHESKQHNWS